MEPYGALWVDVSCTQSPRMAIMARRPLANSLFSALFRASGSLIGSALMPSTMLPYPNLPLPRRHLAGRSPNKKGPPHGPNELRSASNPAGNSHFTGRGAVIPRIRGVHGRVHAELIAAAERHPLQPALRRHLGDRLDAVGHVRELQARRGRQVARELEVLLN